MKWISDRVSAVGIGASIFIGVIFPVVALVLGAFAGLGGFLVPQPKRSTLWYLGVGLAAAAVARLLVHRVLGTVLM